MVCGRLTQDVGQGKVAMNDHRLKFVNCRNKKTQDQHVCEHRFAELGDLPMQMHTGAVCQHTQNKEQVDLHHRHAQDPSFNLPPVRTPS